ncbi:hypothetical protein SAMN05660477_00390 [Soonwooa buanensis]|uniref:Uncharacterized protein n=1 Tax=Soonwooa buanensis TaxID=619805 RepID=A0A1T5CVW9_9FLAO|nr:hypothetical protein [Soonwooa buanensis]SKB63476.1 hypothetical protein SAMN05660477_00390 [Soonwooa buanensis]
MATTKKLMTLLSKQGLTNQRADIIANFTNGRTTSVRALHPFEIDKLCNFFEAEQKKIDRDLDKKRKRVIAVLFGIHEKLNKKVSMQYVKGIACKAAKVEDFNKIPSHRLDTLYAAFLKQEKDLDFSNRYVSGLINEAVCYN